MYKHGISDIYADHKLIYSLFECTRTPEEIIASKPSGFNWLALPETPFGKEFLVVSDRPAHDLPDIEVKSKIFPDAVFDQDVLMFKVKVSNVVRKRLPDVDKPGPIVTLRGREEIVAWFKERALINGFEPFDIELGAIETAVVNKGEKKIFVPSVVVGGKLRITDRDKFKETFTNGLGRSKAYGCGLIQLFPLRKSI